MLEKMAAVVSVAHVTSVAASVLNGNKQLFCLPLVSLISLAPAFSCGPWAGSVWDKTLRADSESLPQPHVGHSATVAVVTG